MAKFGIAKNLKYDTKKYSLQRIASVLINKAAEVIPEMRDVSIYQCPEADQEHDDSDRQYMHVSDHTPINVICYAKAAEELDLGYKVGLITHELGHLALIMLGYEDHEEDQANTAGWWLTGIPIFWRGKKRLEWSPTPDWVLKKL